jgi:hypothetical protein
MEQVSESQLVTGQILVLLQYSLVSCDFTLQSLCQALDQPFIRLASKHGGKDTLFGDRDGEVVEISCLDRGSGFERGNFLGVTNGEERRACLGGDVAGDGTRLVHDEAVIILQSLRQGWSGKIKHNAYDIWHLTKWLLLQVFRSFDGGKIKLDQFIWGLGLFECCKHTLGASGCGIAVKFQDHIAIGKSLDEMGGGAKCEWIDDESECFLWAPFIASQTKA